LNVEWRPFCSGLVLGGFVGGTVRVGISGPHPNRLYSLTFYGGPIQQRREMFLRSRENAQSLAVRVLSIWERSRDSRA